MTQLDHEKYGGVVPEVASRAHLANIQPIVLQTLDKAQISLEDLDAIACTRGPGLMGSLVVGLTYAKGLALGLDIPLIEVNHMQAHVLAHWIEAPQPPFPFINLTVSGGHTQLVMVNSPLDMIVLGETMDDAAGEAFDKVGKMLSLPYPAGPHIDKLAKEGNPDAIEFSKQNFKELTFSFSGLKTSVLYYLQKQMKQNPNYIQENMADICASLQKNIVTILLKKLKQAAKEHHITHIGIGGGVSANSGLRAGLKTLAERQNWTAYIPKFEYCTDNAAMIAIVAHYKYLNKEFASLDISPLARYKL